MKRIFIYLAMGFSVKCNSQTLQFTPTFNSQNLILNSRYSNNSDTLNVSKLIFYITNLKYLKNDSIVHFSNKKAHLINAENINTLNIFEDKEFEFDEVNFCIGVDSSTSIAGIFEGDLDPIHGMYWTWQSGYINFKMEGIVSNRTVKHKKFIWHIGGYQEPFYAMKRVKIVFNSTDKLDIKVSIEKLFEAIKFSEMYQIMSPNAKSMRIADILPLIFLAAE